MVNFCLLVCVCVCVCWYFPDKVSQTICWGLTSN
jgi:hypothetical protein